MNGRNKPKARVWYIVALGMCTFLAGSMAKAQEVQQGVRPPPAEQQAAQGSSDVAQEAPPESEVAGMAFASPSFLETEPNDTIPQVLPPSFSVSGILSTALDVDTYRFSHLEPARLTLRFLHGPTQEPPAQDGEQASQGSTLTGIMEDLLSAAFPVSWQVKLTGPQGLPKERQVSLLFGSRRDRPLHERVIGLWPGAYTVTVRVPFNPLVPGLWSPEPYTLEAIAEPLGDFWDVEPNDSPALAIMVSVGQPVEGWIQRVDDADYYKMDVSKEGYYTFRFTSLVQPKGASTPECVARAELSDDESGTTLLGFCVPPGQTLTQALWLDPARYRLRVFAPMPNTALDLIGGYSFGLFPTNAAITP